MSRDPEREHDDGFGLYVALAIFCTVASAAVACLVVIVTVIKEIL